jgi:malate synthase
MKKRKSLKKTKSVKAKSVKRKSSKRKPAKRVAVRKAAARKTKTTKTKALRAKTSRAKVSRAKTSRGKADAPKSPFKRKAGNKLSKPGKVSKAGGKSRAALKAKKKPVARKLARKPVVVAAPVAPPPPPTPWAIRGHMAPRYADVLSVPALEFLTELHRTFDATRLELLAARADKQKRYDEGALPDFLAATKLIRDDENWRVAPIPGDLMDRRVEITGPVDRKMIVNALNSGATHYMADFEDANAPTWTNNIDGQINLKDYWAGAIDFNDPQSRKRYVVGPKPAVLIVRPRGWHLDEVHLTIDGAPISGALFDFGLYFFHNAQAQIAKGTAPYFYLPKLESHREARLWNDVFLFAQRYIGILSGVIKATVLIETLPAAFEMEEILWEMREHIAGMNAGRWDYIFSFIKTLAKNPNYVLPDRSQVVMGEAFLGSYTALLVKTCHSRGAFAMGGMAAQIPIKGDAQANDAAFAKVRDDKEREVRDGYDGTWVAHPDLVPVAKEVFDRLMPQPNQLERVRMHVRVLPDELLQIHAGTKTDEGFRLNLRVGVQYIESWLRGRGAVPIYHLMEDAATAEISRAQIWQWLKYGAELEGGIKVSRAYFEKAMHEEMERVKNEVGVRSFANGRFPEAIRLFRDLSLSRDFMPFLTIPAYKLIA